MTESVSEACQHAAPSEPTNGVEAQIVHLDGTSLNPDAGTAPIVKASGPYTARELHFMEREEAGELRFEYIVNDGKPEHMIWLTNLKNIFSKQLPNMPKEYIARLVFERRHRSVGIVLPASNKCIGGITYRTFPGTSCRTLGEIAFCAVSATHQVRGHGTRLMNWTKQHARVHDGITHFLTYADNNAVGYFAKQGFTKEISLPRERWAPFIKDYDGGTLMEFVVHPRVPYATLPRLFARQAAALEARLRQASTAHVVRGPLFKSGEPLQPRDPRDIPGVIEAGYTGPRMPEYELAVNGSVVPATPAAQRIFMRHLLDKLLARDAAEAFRAPVDAALVPDYYSIVRDPMDLGTIAGRLNDGVYVTLELFLADLRRIWSNARLYNAPETVFYKDACTLEEVVEGEVYSSTHWLH